MEEGRLDRQRGLVGERREQGQVVPVEALPRELLLEREDSHEPLAIDERHEEPEPLGRETLAKLLALAVGEVQRDLLEVRGLALLPEDPADGGRRREAILPPAPPLEPALPVPQPDGGLVEAHRRGDARGQVVGDAAEVELAGDRLAHLEEGGLVVELLAEEELVERGLELPPQDLEERDADEEEAEVEEGRGREARRREDQVREGDDEGVEAEEDGRGPGVEEGPPHDHAHVQHLEAHDRVRERHRDQDHRDDPVEGVLVDSECRGQNDEEEDERHDPEDRPDEDVEGLAALARVLEREGRVREGHEAEDEVVAEKDPGGQRRAREDGDPLAPHLAHHVVEEDDRRNRIEQVEERRARRQKLLQPDLPARGRLSRPLVGPSEVEALGARKDQEEVEEDGRHQKEADRAGALDEDVDPPVRGRPQAADEEEQEEDAQQKEDAGRALLRHPDEDEEPDQEEEETDDDRVEIGPSSEPLGGELEPARSGAPCRGRPRGFRGRRRCGRGSPAARRSCGGGALPRRRSSCGRSAGRCPGCTRRP